jgi:hypothetical protein
MFLQLVAQTLWALWVLPKMNEEGSPRQIAVWLGVQVLFLCLLFLILLRRKKYSFWSMFVYAATLLLFAIGLLGWALMGLSTPLAVYAVCGLFFLSSFGMMIASLKDLGVRQRQMKSFEDE